MGTRLVGVACRTGRIAALATVAIVAIGVNASPQEPPKPARPRSLARFFPARDLVVYAEFDGLDAHRDTWSKTAAYRILNETTTGEMLEQTLARLLDAMGAGDDVSPVKGRELVGLGEHLLRAGFAVGINRAGGVGPPRSFGLVIRGGAKGQIRQVFDRFLRAGLGPAEKIKPVAKPGGRSVSVLSDEPRAALARWFEGDDLAISVVSPTGVDAMIAALDGREPSALDHPTRRELVKSDDAAGLEPVGLAFFAMAALPPLPREAVALGLDRIRRLDYRWGFRGPAIESIVGAVVPSPRTGIPALFDQPSLDVNHLPPLPGGLRGFTVLSLDAGRLYDQVTAALKSVDPTTAALAVTQFEVAAQQALGMRLRQDVLAPMGSRVIIYNFPATVDAPAHLIEGIARALVLAPRTAVVLELKDRDAMAKALANLAARGAQKVQVNESPSPGVKTTVTVSVAPLRALKGPDTGYVFLASAEPGSFALPAGMHPALVVGGKELVFGTTIATARRARDHHERSAPGLPPGDPLAAALDNLPDRLMFLSVSDSRRSMLADLIVGAPNLAETLISQQEGGLLTSLEFLFNGHSGFRIMDEAPVTVAPPTLIVPPPPTGPVVEPQPPPAGAVVEPQPLAGAVVEAVPPGAIVEPDRPLNIIELGGGKPKKPPSTPAFDPERIPDADDLRQFLFPSVSALAVDDRGIRFITREALPTINPATAVPVALAMIIPAANASRIAAQRSQSVMNLKQIGLALHNYNSANGHFPADVRGKDGKPLLSWRVQILPFIEQGTLSQAFKLDEPWDSPHNKALLERMPAVFAVPGARAEPGMTFYRGFTGKGTLFDPALPQGVELAKITDGTSNTIALVEAREAVPWTRPDSDIPFKAEAPAPESLNGLLEALGGRFPGGFNVLFCDGSIRFIPETVNRLTLRSLITRDGGETVSADSF